MGIGIKEPAEGRIEQLKRRAEQWEVGRTKEIKINT
jgi:hypothetical protein